jgi:transposase
LASEILRNVRTLDRKIADLNGRIEAEVEASGTTLTEIFGIGPILAARIVGTVGDVGRFPTKAHFASYSGTAPVEASSGEAVRHRLSLAGNRKLNYALHMVAVCQARSDARGGIYYRKKIAEGKSRKEALRCLKRRVSDAVFRNLVADSQAPSRSAAWQRGAEKAQLRKFNFWEFLFHALGWIEEWEASQEPPRQVKWDFRYSAIVEVRRSS